MYTVMMWLQSVASACKKIVEGDEVVCVDGCTVVSRILHCPTISHFYERQ